MSENHAGTGAGADEQRRFRTALSMFATGVAVITAPRKEGCRSASRSRRSIRCRWIRR